MSESKKKITKTTKGLLATLMLASVVTPAVVMHVNDVNAATPNEVSDFWVKPYGAGVEIAEYYGTRKDVVIPDTIDGKPVVRIGMGAFLRAGITSVEIPKTVTTIGAFAFNGNSLTSVELPEGLTKIDATAFYANQLVTANIPSTVTSIGQGAFYGNKLEKVTLPSGVNIASGTTGSSGSGTVGVFEANNIKELIMTDGGSTSIGDRAFKDNQIESIIVPSSVTYIGGEAFRNNSISNVAFGSSSTVITNGAFAGNQQNAALLVMKGYDPSTAKTYANTYYHTFNIVTPEDLKPPVVEPEEPTKPTLSLWTKDSEPGAPFVSTMIPEVSVMGGKAIQDIKLDNVDMKFTEPLQTSLGEITLTSDDDGNTLFSAPKGLGDSSTNQTLKVIYNETHIMTIKVVPAPKLNFSF